MNNRVLTDIPILETENYRLRGIRIEDVSALFPILSHHETMQYITPTPVLTEEALGQIISENLSKFAEQKEIPWVIVQKETNQVIGQFRLHKLHSWHRKTEMGVVIDKRYQNRGVMTELLPIVLEYAFCQLNLNRVVGDIFAKNEGSKKLLEKYGFIKEGILRQTDYDGTTFHDTVVYSLLKDEYIELTRRKY